MSVLLALTILAFAAGSSSVARAGEVGRPARWWLLGALGVVSAAYSLRRRRSPIVLAAPTVLAAVLLVVALGSTSWSGSPHVTFHRAASLALLLVTAGLLAYGSAGERARVEPILVGVLGGAVLVGLASLLVGAADPGAAGSLRTRYRGFGEQATTDAMLYALALPVAFLAVLRARTRVERAAAAGAFALLDGLLVVSGSRGPEVGAVLGLVLLGLVRSRMTRLAGGGLAVATAALALAVGLIQTSREPAAAPAHPTVASTAPTRYPNPGLLSQELGSRSDSSVIRSLFRSSGRTGAWRGAVRKANERPVLGWGFGTEDRVFENHHYGYQGALVGSSWVGLYLQLGALGVALLAAVWLVLGGAVVRTARRLGRDPVALTCAGVVAAAFPITFVESWIYAAGNVASLPFWAGALRLGTIVWGRTRKEADPVAA